MMESASLVPSAGAIVADEKSGFSESNAYESQPMMFDAKIDAIRSVQTTRDANRAGECASGAAQHGSVK